MKKINHYLIKDEFELVFKNNQDCKFIRMDMIDTRLNISWSNYLRDAINKLKEEGYDFNYIAEMDIITFAHKRDTTYDFFLKLNMPMIELQLNKLFNKDEHLVKKFPRN